MFIRAVVYHRFPPYPQKTSICNSFYSEIVCISFHFIDKYVIELRECSGFISVASFKYYNILS